MSWDAYVTNLKSGPGQCHYAAIVGKEGGVWAASQTTDPVHPDAADMTKILGIMKACDKSIFGTGIVIKGIKYTTIFMDEECLMLQGKEDKKDYKIVACMSNQAMLFGFNNDSAIKTNNVRNGVEGMKEYLKGTGY